MTEGPGDEARVRELLGREPQGRYTVAVRDGSGDPVVLRNAPFLDDGTPMPTRYWLIGPGEIRRIGQLEAGGGVDEAEAAIDPSVLADAHARYAAERDAEIPADHTGPRPTGGVGGTRIGVKCLHAHWAWHLAGGDDPVGRWIERRLASSDESALGTVVEIGEMSTAVLMPGARWVIPWGAENITDRWLRDDDPPRPESLTNTLGTIADHLDDIAREHPGFIDIVSVELTGPTVASLACVEVGTETVREPIGLRRDAAEEIFRMLATEPTRDRAHNPGLPSAHVEPILATCCIVLALMRRLHLEVVTLHPAAEH